MKLFVVIISMMGLLFRQSVGSHNSPHNVTQTSGKTFYFKIEIHLIFNYDKP